MKIHEIARIIEPSEAKMREHWWNLMPAELARQHKPRVTRIDGALVTLLRGSTSKSMNVVLNLGVTETAKESMIDEIVAFAREGKVKRFCLHLSPSGQSSVIEKWITKRGFKFHSYHRNHFRDTSEPAPVQTDLKIKQIGAKHASAFAQVVCGNFGWPSGRVPWIAATVGEPGFNHYMAFDKDRPVATGLLYVEGDCGYLAFGATMTPYRRRGGQRALIAARIMRARQLGLKYVAAETFEPARGRPATSYRNFIRSGFSDAYGRAVFVWEE